MNLGGIGYDFIGNFKTKGCYYYKEGKYAGRAYYGTVDGGDVQTANQLTSLSSGRFRVPNHDCAEAPTTGVPTSMTTTPEAKPNGSFSLLLSEEF